MGCTVAGSSKADGLMNLCSSCAIYYFSLFLDSAWSNNRRLIIETDCNKAVEWIKEPGSCSPLFASLVKEIAAIVLERNVILKVIPRCGNWEVDSLAKSGIG